jgi:hypothetical protein
VASVQSLPSIFDYFLVLRFWVVAHAADWRQFSPKMRLIEKSEKACDVLKVEGKLDKQLFINRLRRIYCFS